MPPIFCRRPALGFLLAASTALVAMPALSQDSQAEVLTLDPIVIRGEDEYGFAADRAAAAYVSPADIERARTGTLRQLFAGTASVSVGGGIPLAQKIYVNGIDMLNLSVQVDGVLQNNRTFHHVSSNAFDPGLLKRVRIDPGVAAADLGPNAVAGGVIMETISAEDVLEEGRSFGGNALVGYEDNGRTFSRSATVAGRQGAFDWLLYGRRVTGDNFRTGAGDKQAGTGANLENFLAKAGVNIGGHRLEFSAQQLTDSEFRPFRANLVGIIGRPADLRLYDTTRRNFALTYRNTEADDLFDPRLTLGYSESVVKVPVPYGSDSTTGTWSFKAENVFTLGTLGTVTAGIDGYDRDGVYDGPVPSDHFEEKARNIGIFAQARLEPAERLKLSFGLRADWQEFEGIGGYKDEVSGVSGNLNVSYGITEELWVRAGYSDIFGGIGLEDTFIFVPSWTYTDLRPSRAQNVIIGADYTLGALRLSAEAFRTDVSRARSAQTTVDFVSEGFNLAVGYGWDTGDVRASFTRADLTVDGNETETYYLRNFGTLLGDVIKIEAQQRIGTAWTLGGSIDASLDYDKGTSAPLEGYTVTNAFAEWEPEQAANLLVRLEVRNLFDQTYSDRASYGQDYPTGTGGVIPMREPGRTVALSVRYKF